MVSIRLPKDIYTYYVVFTTNILSWIFGASVSWSSPVISKLQDNTYDNPIGRRITDDEASWLASGTTFGLIFGPLVLGKLPDILGRKNTYLLISFPVVVCYGILSFSSNIYAYIIARVILGVSIGEFFSCAGLYVGELSHSRNRGFFGSSLMLTMEIGMIFSYAVGPFATIFVLNISLFVCSIIFIPLFYLIALESPFYLLLKNKDDEALAVLLKLRGDSIDNVEKELEDIRMNAKDSPKESLLVVFKSSAARKALFVAGMISGLQHLTGVSLILMYAQQFFKDAGSSLSPEICPIILGAIQCSMSFVCQLTCDRVGRKILLYISTVGIGISMIVLGFYFNNKGADSGIGSLNWLPIVCAVFAVASRDVGLASIPPLITAELFPMNAKCIGSTLVVALSGMVLFLATKYYMEVNDAIGGDIVAWFFGIMSFFVAVFSYIFITETKGKTLSEIQNMMSNQKNDNNDNKNTGV